MAISAVECHSAPCPSKVTQVHLPACTCLLASECIRHAVQQGKQVHLPAFQSLKFLIQLSRVLLAMKSLLTLAINKVFGALINVVALSLTVSALECESA